MNLVNEKSNAKFLLLGSTLCMMILLTSHNASGASGLIPTITPIVAYEQVTVLRPEKHTQERVSYGAKARMGWRIFGLELSYLKGKFDKTFVDGSRNISETEKARVGFSSILGWQVISFNIAAGMEGRRETETITDVNQNTTKTGPTDVLDPYASGHVRVRLTSIFTFTAGVTYTFIDENKPFDLGKQKEEVSAGFVIRF